MVAGVEASIEDHTVEIHSEGINTEETTTEVSKDGLIMEDKGITTMDTLNLTKATTSRSSNNLYRPKDLVKGIPVHQISTTAVHSPFWREVSTQMITPKSSSPTLHSHQEFIRTKQTLSMDFLL